MKYLRNSSLLLASVVTFCCSSILGQELTISGGELTIQNNATLTIEGSLLNENNGNIHHEGLLTVENDIVNNGGNVLFTPNSTGRTQLIGANQSIGGADSIVFYNLDAFGQNASMKALFVSVSVLNELNIENQEIALNSNQLYLLNNDVHALSYIDGFISGDTLGGYFYRSMNSTSTYNFPVGSINLFPVTRPVFITPNSSDSTVIGVRLAAINIEDENTGVSATGASGPFDINLKDASLSTFNKEYYHNIFQLFGNESVKVEMDYLATDGDFMDMAQYQNGQFNPANFTVVNVNNGFFDRSIVNSSLNNFNHDIFVLSDINVTINVPGGVSVNNDGLNDFFTIMGLEFYPDNSLEIYNRWGDLVFKEAPYSNNWQGESNVNALLGDEVTSGTYFYVLRLTETSEPITGYFELKK